MDFFIVWVHYKEHSLKRRVYYSLLLFIFFCAIAAEMTQRVRIESITSFILFALFAFYLSLQSPGFYVDTATGAYNRDGFFEMLKERIAYCRKTSCLLLRVRNFHSMNQIYGEEILQEVQRQIYFILKENGRNGTVYHIGASTFALILRDENQLKSVYEQLSVKIPTEWLVKNEVVKHEYSFYQRTARIMRSWYKESTMPALTMIPIIRPVVLSFCTVVQWRSLRRKRKWRIF